MEIVLTLRAVLRWIKRTLLAGGRRRVEVIRYDSGHVPRTPFQMPLRVAAVGEVALAAAKSLVEQGGVQIVYLRRPEHLRDYDGLHILIAEPADLGRVAELAVQGGVEKPALIVSIGSNWSLIRKLWSIPRGVAVLAVRAVDAPKALASIWEEVAKDRPLETALKEGARSIISRRRGLLLIFDRAANDALRSGDAYEMFRIAAQAAGKPVPLLPGSPTPNLWQISQGLRGNESPFARSIESRSPLVDINILRATYRPDRPRMLRRGTTMQAATDYLVAIHVGARLETSIIRGQDSESSDGSFAGDAKPDVLDFAIQDKELKVVSRRMRQLILHPEGAPQMIFFHVRTPPQMGKASLRVLLYRRNQMLQSFLVEADITEREVELEASDRGVIATMDFSQAEDLSSASEEPAPDRVLTISINRDASSTHGIFLKGALDAVGFSISESGVKARLEAFRNILLEASYIDGVKAVTPRQWPTTGRPGSDSEKYIKELARLGGEMYWAYFDVTADPLGATLKEIRTSSDKTISVIRHDERFSFPWPILYDMHLPRSLKAAKLCYGESAPGVECGHVDEKGELKDICIRGFWGYRHRLEELIGGNRPKPNVRSTGGAAGTSSLGYLIDSGIKHAKNVENLLSEAKGRDVLSGVGDVKDLLNNLWDDQKRPDILVFFGHLNSKANDDEPIGSRIRLPGFVNDDWLVSREILEYLADHNPWGAPNPVVVLLACESAATTPETLTDFVIAFHRARASAIIGTECLALSDCMERFSKAFFPLVWTGNSSLSEAMMQVRRALLQQGYPLAFVFSCIGTAELKVNRT